MTIASAKYEKAPQTVLNIFISELQLKLAQDLPEISSWDQFSKLFTRAYLKKPLILIVDEFDALEEEYPQSDEAL